MKNSISTALAAALVVLAAPAEAQLRPFTLGIQGGPSLAEGRLEREAATGYHVQGSVEFAPALLPVGVRADALWQEFSDEDPGSFRQIGFLANGILRLPLPLLSPYLVAGPGVFRNRAQGDDASETFVGWSAGVGVRFGLLGLGAVAEARYVNAGGEQQSVPLGIGIRF